MYLADAAIETKLQAVMSSGGIGLDDVHRGKDQNTRGILDNIEAVVVSSGACDIGVSPASKNSP